MSANLLSQGLELLVYGMGTVVVFLTLLVFATRLMSILIQRFFPQAPAPVRRPGLRSAAASPASSPEMLAAITAAVHQHRRREPITPVADSDQRKAHV